MSPEAFAKAFGLRLKELRRQAGLSQVELAERAGLSKSALTHYEQGLRSPSWESLLALSEALGVELDAFKAPPASPEKTPRGRPRKAATRGQAGPKRPKGRPRKEPKK